MGLESCSVQTSPRKVISQLLQPFDADFFRIVSEVGIQIWSVYQNTNVASGYNFRQGRFDL